MYLDLTLFCHALIVFVFLGDGSNDVDGHRNSERNEQYLCVRYRDRHLRRVLSGGACLCIEVAGMRCDFESACHMI